MGLFQRRTIRRTGPNRYAFSLDPEGRAFVAELTRQLRALLEDTTDDPNLRRLFPTAYHLDEERDREYQQLVRDDLLAHRLAAIDVLTATLEQTELDQAQLTAWMSAVNDLRLVLGTTLDVTEDGRPPTDDDPAAALYAAYGYLTALLDEVVAALSDGLGDEVPDEPPSA
jgi:AcrR family transcriptional regulator